MQIKNNKVENTIKSFNKNHSYNCTPDFLTYFNKFDYFPTRPKKINVKELKKSPFKHYLLALKELGFIHIRKDSDPNYIVARGTPRGEDFSYFFHGNLSTIPKHTVIANIIFCLVLLIAFFAYNNSMGIFSITSYIALSLVLIILGVILSINLYKDSYRDSIIKNDITIPNIAKFCDEDYMNKSETKRELNTFKRFHLLKPINKSK